MRFHFPASRALLPAGVLNNPTPANQQPSKPTTSPSSCPLGQMAKSSTHSPQTNLSPVRDPAGPGIPTILLACKNQHPSSGTPGARPHPGICILERECLQMISPPPGCGRIGARVQALWIVELVLVILCCLAAVVRVRDRYSFSGGEVH
jgi:hypothetical protein